MKNITAWFVLIILVIIAAIAIVAYEVEKPAAPASTGASATSTSSLNNQVGYSCLNGKTINADYTDNNVALALSDGRTLSLPQVMSGSGIRYEQSSGPGHLTTFESEGNNAFLTEDGTITYNNCVAGTTATGTNSTGIVAGMTTYTDPSKTFSFSYPAEDVTISGGGVGYDTNWKQEATTSGLLLAVGDISSSFEPNTNFADAKFTVGTSPDPQAVATCLSEGNGNPVTSSKVNINGIPFTKLTFSDAAAGNVYDTVSYRTVRNSQCYAVEYTIHYGNIQNYPPNSGISAFNETQVKNVLEGIVQSFKFY
jgi:membrane-bound inhibitor of C-type lysozyme